MFVTPLYRLAHNAGKGLVPHTNRACHVYHTRRVYAGPFLQVCTVHYTNNNNKTRRKYTLCTGFVYVVFVTC